MKALTNLAYVAAIGFSLILLSAPIIQPILMFMTYVKIQEEPLTASKALATVAFFNIMRFPFAFLPMGLLQYIQRQKARVSFARVLYEENTKVVLLDDTLSAIDAHVGEHLFEHAVAGDLWKEPPTRILVTRHIYFLPRCDKVIVIYNGSGVHFWAYSELVKDGFDFVGAVDFDEEKEEKEEGKVSSEEKDITPLLILSVGNIYTVNFIRYFLAIVFCLYLSLFGTSFFPTAWSIDWVFFVSYRYFSVFFYLFWPLFVFILWCV